MKNSIEVNEMERYSVTEAQMFVNGAIAHQSFDYGTNGTAAKGHYHSALASGLASGLIAETVTLVTMDDATGFGHAQSETVKGTGVLEIEGGNT